MRFRRGKRVIHRMEIRAKIAYVANVNEEEPGRVNTTKKGVPVVRVVKVVLFYL